MREATNANIPVVDVHAKDISFTEIPDGWSRYTALQVLSFPEVQGTKGLYIFTSASPSVRIVYCNRGPSAMVLTWRFLLQLVCGKTQDDWCLPLAELLCSAAPDEELRRAVIEMADDLGKHEFHSIATLLSLHNQFWIVSWTLMFWLFVGSLQRTDLCVSHLLRCGTAGAGILQRLQLRSDWTWQVFSGYVRVFGWDCFLYFPSLVTKTYLTFAPACHSKNQPSGKLWRDLKFMNTCCSWPQGSPSRAFR